MKTNWLNDFLKRFLVTQNDDGAGDSSNPPDPDMLKTMVRGIVTTRQDEIGCDECFEQVDRFAEMVLEGRTAAEALPLVGVHKKRCVDCRGAFEAHLNELRAWS